jgi:hypothetical protein
MDFLNLLPYMSGHAPEMPSRFEYSRDRVGRKPLLAAAERLLRSWIGSGIALVI